MRLSFASRAPAHNSLSCGWNQAAFLLLRDQQPNGVGADVVAA